MIGPESDGAVHSHTLKILIGCLGGVLLATGVVSSVTSEGEWSHRGDKGGVSSINGAYIYPASL